MAAEKEGKESEESRENCLGDWCEAGFQHWEKNKDRDQLRELAT